MLAPQSQSQKAALNSAACSGIHPHQLSPKQRLRNIMLLHVNSPLPVSLHTVPPSLCPFTVEKRRANKDAAAAMPPPLLRALIEVCALYAGVEAKQRWLRRFRPLKKELPASVFNFSLTMEAAEAEASQIPVQTCTLLFVHSAAMLSPPLHCPTTLIH